MQIPYRFLPLNTRDKTLHMQLSTTPLLSIFSRILNVTIIFYHTFPPWQGIIMPTPRQPLQ